MFDVNDLASIKVGLASPEKIREWSHGEVTKPETINYRSQKPEMDGLFCEKIFGPAKDYECHCGKYKKIRYAGVVCERCGVEVISKEVRRERMGHIELASPCSHIWYLKGIPSRMGLVLGLSAKQLEEIIYFSAHVCLNPGTCKSLAYKQFLDNSTGREAFTAAVTEILEGIENKESYDYDLGKNLLEGLTTNGSIFNFYACASYISERTGAEFGEGAEAIKRLLKEVDLKAEFEATDAEIKGATGQKLTKATKKLEVLASFIKSGNKPEWMILDAIPVIPPDLRPMLQLDGGRFAASDLNDLYRRIITRNNRLKGFIAAGAARIIVSNEKRMLQEAVDALIDNGRRNGKPVTGVSGRPLKSLSGALKGKQGRFRQNLLGKRVDYSGRSVIAIGPDLKMYQCGLPREMAINLLRPFIAAILISSGKCLLHKQADRKIDAKDSDVYDVVEQIISEHPVLLNRAPTLHRLGIQAFQPVLVEGRAIRLHPLVCTGFNADFDGDQMAVHVPVGKAAQEEAVDLMLASNNILAPRDGKPIVTPGQDILIGNYYLTMEADKKDFVQKAKTFEVAGDLNESQKYINYSELEGKVFKDMDEVVKVYESGLIHLHDRIALRGSSMKKKSFTPEMMDSYLITTVGKVIFNFAFPSDFPYINTGDKKLIKDNLNHDLIEYFVPKGTNITEYIASLPLKEPVVKGDITMIINAVYHKYGTEKTSAILDKIKDQGYKYSTISGLSIAISDINVLSEKKGIVESGDEKINQVNELFDEGFLTEEERHKQVINVWKKAYKEVQADVNKKLEGETRNPLYIMWHSGARGSSDNFTQLIGLRGVMTSTTGDIELPVKSSFREGMNISEFYTGTHSARKTGCDTALKTADAGYLTRRLVDVSQDVIVREIDCHSDHGTIVSEIYDPIQKFVVIKLEDRLEGRYTCHNVIDPVTGEIVVKANTLISLDDAKNIVAHGIKSVEIRSLFGCETKDGVCQHCYGTNLASGKPVEIGEAVGIMAAQSIGEPGTQLTLKNFHSGGVASAEDITKGLPRVTELLEARNPKGEATISEIVGVVDEISEKNGIYTIIVKNDLESKTYETNFGARLIVAKGDEVVNGSQLTEGAVSPKKLLECSDNAITEAYIVQEIHKVYKDAGINISDKHIEVIVRQMLRKVVIIDGGDTNLIPGTRVTLNTFSNANNEILLQGKHPAAARPLILGITKAALETESFLSAASFQETTRVLTDAAIKGKTDTLHGLKENVITGKLIPAGRGLLSQVERDVIVDNFDVSKRMADVKKQYIGVHDVNYDEQNEDIDIQNMESLITERTPEEEAEVRKIEGVSEVTSIVDDKDFDDIAPSAETAKLD